MSDVPVDAPTPDAAADDAVVEETVPAKKFSEMARHKKALEDEVASLRAAVDERENANLPELERERKQRERFEAQAADAEARAEAADQRLARLERGGWVRDAAAEAGFLNPSAAEKFLDLGDIETATQARNAVKKLADQEKYLVRQEGDKPALDRVLQGNDAAGVKSNKPVDGEDARDALGAGLLDFLTQQRG